MSSNPERIRWRLRLKGKLIFFKWNKIYLTENLQRRPGCELHTNVQRTHLLLSPESASEASLILQSRKRKHPWRQDSKREGTGLSCTRWRDGISNGIKKKLQRKRKCRGSSLFFAGVTVDDDDPAHLLWFAKTTTLLYLKGFKSCLPISRMKDQPPLVSDLCISWF